MKASILSSVILLGLTFSACQKPNEAVTEKPAIKSVSFVGIPDKNVRFDAPNATITVQLPAVLPGGLQPIFNLSEGASVVDGVMADNTIDLTSFCACNPSSNIAKDVIIRVRHNTTTSVYHLNVLAAGSLKAQASTTPITFSRKTKLLEMSLPVENLYSNPHINTILFTNTETGSVARISADAACLSGCQASAPNQLMFRLSSPIETELRPGIYAISLGGINFPQRLIVTD